jgi:hypothetical protein
MNKLIDLCVGCGEDNQELEADTMLCPMCYRERIDCADDRMGVIEWDE